MLNGIVLRFAVSLRIIKRKCTARFRNGVQWYNGYCYFVGM